MAILQWERFDFVNVLFNADNKRIVNYIKHCNKIQSCSSCSNQKIICDSNGNVHVFYPNWKVVSFEAHKGPIVFCTTDLQNNLLLTIAKSSSTDCNVKVWDLKKLEKMKGAPFLLAAEVNINRITCASICKRESLIFVAVGFETGYLTILSKHCDQPLPPSFRNIPSGAGSILGIEFQENHKLPCYMYVCSTTALYLFTLEKKDVRKTSVLLEHVNTPTCCNFPRPKNHSFIFGADSGIHLYNKVGSGQRYVLDGHKHIIKSFNNYVIIVMDIPTKNESKVRILVVDIYNKFIAFNAISDPIKGIFHEGDSCLILTATNKVFELIEKDVQSKLSVLFKKNLQDVGIQTLNNITTKKYLGSTQFQCGNYLYSKGDLSGAVEKYIQATENSERSFVLKKFLKVFEISYLCKYLKNIISTDKMRNLANHCELRSNLHSEKFMQVYLQGYAAPKSFLEKSQNLKDFSNFFSDGNAYRIYKLFNASSSMVMSKDPYKISSFLINICEQNAKIDQKEHKKNHIQKLIPIFGFEENIRLCLEFLHTIIIRFPACGIIIYNALIELYLKHSTHSFVLRKCLIKLMKLYAGQYCKTHILILCCLSKFGPGKLELYTKEKEKRNAISNFFLNEPQNARTNYINYTDFVLDSPIVPNKFVFQKISAPLEMLRYVVGVIGCDTDVGTIKSYKKVLENHRRNKVPETAYITKLKEKLNFEKELLASFSTNPIEFRSAECDACHRTIALPAIYTLCQHSFHQNCVQINSENGKHFDVV